jgi:nitrous oxide reductase
MPCRAPHHRRHHGARFPEHAAAAAAAEACAFGGLLVESSCKTAVSRGERERVRERERGERGE